MKAIETAKAYSQEKVAALREAVAGKVPPGDVVVLCGSFAREEASEESDADWFAISRERKPAEQSEFDPSRMPWLHEVRQAVKSVVRVDPAADGAFADFENRDAMLANIGGDADTNGKITRRMLLLLEGCPLTDKADFDRFRRSILDRYIGGGISDSQLALFLLNDIIRYYRTMTVDYEFKTGEGATPKPWGLRNIKLVFSRKLLYASGLFSVAITANRTPDQKIETLERLFDMPVLDRMIDICGQRECENLLHRYDTFLARLEDGEARESLKTVNRDERRDHKIFRELKNEGHQFTRELLKLYDRTFDATHPIRRAVLF